MTTHKEALKLALEALEKLTNAAEGFSVSGVYFNEELWARKCLDDAYDAMGFAQEALAQPEQEPVAKAMTAHRAAYFMERFKHEEKLLGPNEQAALDFVISMLEAQPEQEPVAWEEGESIYFKEDQGLNDWIRANGTPLYRHPPQRTWVGLTDEEIWDTPDYEETRKMYRFAKAIEAKLKEKNT